MPFADFQPSNAGAQLNQQILGNVEFGRSLMERAARHTALLQDIEQKSQRFLREQQFDTARLEDVNLQLTRMRGEQELAPKLREALLLRLEAESADNLSRADSRKASASLLTEASNHLKGYKDRIAAAQTIDEVKSIAAQYHQRFGQLEKDADFSSRYRVGAGELAALAQATSEGFAVQIRVATRKLAGMLRGTEESLEAVRNDPAFSLAQQDPDFSRRIEVEMEKWQAHRMALAQIAANEKARSSPDAPPAPAKPRVTGERAQEILRQQRVPNWSPPPESKGNPMS